MESETAGSPQVKTSRRASWIVAVTSFVFILLQSACTAVMAISGLRLVIGVTSLVAASVIPGFIFKIHAERIRIPMMIVAVVGSLINLYVLWRIRSLRSRPASQWRVQVITAKQRRSELFQIAISVLTLMLVAIEILAHHHLHGSF